jgi:hypothetical protein
MASARDREGRSAADLKRAALGDISNQALAAALLDKARAPA